MKLIVEFNTHLQKSRDTTFSTSSGIVMITPQIDENYWLMRVPVSKDQAVVCFPKFCTLGIGFQHEDDWNTNLPYTCEAEKIYNHIKHNKGNKNIRRETCITAIQMLQSAIQEYKKG